MKVAVSTSRGGREDSVFPVFGRCPTFTVLETSGKPAKASVITNPGAAAGGGAGIAAAQAVVEAGANAVITGSCGPNALQVLLASGIEVYSGSGKVGAAVKDLAGGRLARIGQPAAPHSGMGRRGFGRQRGRCP